MSAPSASVFNIAPGGDFLQVLTKEILLGFPFGQNERLSPPLPNWTILLPTRRAARSLGTLLTEACGQQALLLPTIRPIGDIDDGRLHDVGAAANIPNAISRTGQVLLMLDLLKTWAKQNPQAKIASEIEASQIQSLALANSLLQLVDQMETGETDFQNLSEAYNVELSDHRTALLSLLALLKLELPQKLLLENKVGSSARRSLLIRLEANRVANSALKGPIIAAGSTGTIPATRALLGAIARHPQGAVILPGLDLQMSDDDWAAIGPDHPQYSLQALLNELKLERKSIVSLSAGNQFRNFMNAEVMRPSATAEKWHKILGRHKADMEKAIENLHIIKAPDRHLEARSISLILRHSLETLGQTAALVTPDRDLAQRVKSELLRWNILIDDTAGENLHRHGIAALAVLLLQALSNNFPAADFLALFSHPDCSIGSSKDEHLSNLRNLELAAMRSYGSSVGIDGIKNALKRAHEAKLLNKRSHPLVSKLTEDDWSQYFSFLQNVETIIAPLQLELRQTAEKQVENFITVLKQIAPDADWSLPENQAFANLLEELQQESARLPESDFASISPIILHLLREKTFQLPKASHPRLAIYGVLEARLMSADIMILGALNEGRWPAQPETGPWLNRPMRALFGMQMPERDIGVSAHDFTQALGYSKIYLTTSKRLDGSPQIPSRWLLRLQTIVEAAGLKANSYEDPSWVELAKLLDASIIQNPQKKPKPSPPLSARPTHFSVTEIEKLIRDPYAIYAKRVLKIEPLPHLSKPVDAALRGTLFHDALRIWNEKQVFQFSPDIEKLLLMAGEQIFAPFKEDAEIANFWWSRFKKIAHWIADQEPNFRITTAQVHAEISGQLEFNIGQVPHKLTAKADRIDSLRDGTARIIDYKSGTPPTPAMVRTALSPQLPLEAAILLAEGFPAVKSRLITEMLYLHITGSSPAGAVKVITPPEGQSFETFANAQLAGLKSLLGKYQNHDQAYLPRAVVKLEDETTEYDHLSRFKEWVLAGGP